MSCFTSADDESFSATFHGLKIVSAKYALPASPSRINSSARICLGNGFCSTFRSYQSPFGFGYG